MKQFEVVFTLGDCQGMYVYEVKAVEAIEAVANAIDLLPDLGETRVDEIRVFRIS